jgi:ABC-2 type transport system permease protein
MSLLTRQVRVSYAFVERNFNLVKRYWGWEVVWLVYSIVNALSITFIGKASAAITGQAMTQPEIDTVILYLLLGTLVWHYLAMVFGGISDMIAWERWEGTIEYTFMAPISRFTHMIGSTLFSLVYGLLHTALILAVVVLFFHLDLRQANLLGATMVLLAGSVSFVGLGIVASVMPLLFPERGAQMTHIIKASILLVSGVYYPIEVLPGWMQKVATVSPATYVLQGVRTALIDGASLSDLLHFVWPLLIIGAIMVPVGVHVFGVCERYAKRTGRLKRNG